LTLPVTFFLIPAFVMHTFAFRSSNLDLGFAAGPVHCRWDYRISTPVHRAREAIVLAKRTGRWAAVGGIPARAQQVADALLRLAGETRNAWTDRQVEIARAHRTRPLRKDVAVALGVSPSVVSESLKAARFDAVREADDAVAALLDRAAEEGMRG